MNNSIVINAIEYVQDWEYKVSIEINGKPWKTIKGTLSLVEISDLRSAIEKKYGMKPPLKIYTWDTSSLYLTI